MHLVQRPDQDSYLPLLERVHNLISIPLEGQAFFDQLLDELIGGLEIDACWIHLLSPENEELNLVSHRGLTKEMVEEIKSLRLGQALPGKVALIKEPLIATSMYPGEKRTLASNTRTDLCCFIAAPMMDRTNVLGIIGLGSRISNKFTVYDLKLLSIISSGVAVAADRAYLLHSKGEREKVELFSVLSEEKEFINSLSHELQTPLTALIASAGLLIGELQKESKGPQLRLAQNIAHSASSLQNRLTELIDLSRTKTTRFRIKRQPFDFSTLAQKVIEELSPLLNNKEQSIAVEMPTSISITADEQRVEQILLNLLANAVKFTPQNGKITLKAQQNKDSLIVEVRDTGPGIPEDEQKKLFRPYYRTSTDTHRLPGLGLGLAITKQLVELHKGRIWMESKPGKGSTFAFSLPLS